MTEQNPQPKHQHVVLSPWPALDGYIYLGPSRWTALSEYVGVVLVAAGMVIGLGAFLIRFACALLAGINIVFLPSRMTPTEWVLPDAATPWFATLALWALAVPMFVIFKTRARRLPVDLMSTDMGLTSPPQDILDALTDEERLSLPQALADADIDRHTRAELISMRKSLLGQSRALVVDQTITEALTTVDQRIRHRKAAWSPVDERVRQRRADEADRAARMNEELRDKEALARIAELTNGEVDITYVPNDQTTEPNTTATCHQCGECGAEQVHRGWPTSHPQICWGCGTPSHLDTGHRRRCRAARLCTRCQAAQDLDLARIKPGAVDLGDIRMSHPAVATAPTRK